ncbi:hypothetical protein HU200_048066 [Digitaria exilis]|uniref:Uncharacterized protein n=1 Tax=Digitaria exilis TaxID=1010633 RepID=A0A835E9R5_9POAL|nr:hypothetical protein HU200_048066 [Digitaria exilis]
MVSPARDYVGGRRLWLQHLVTTRLAAACGGFLSLAWHLRYGSSSKDDACDNSVRWNGGGGCVRE